MRRSVLFPLIFLLALSTLAVEGANKTAIFLGHKSSWNKIKIELRDIQALFGGRDLTLNGSGKAHIETSYPRKIEAGLTNKSYDLSLPPKDTISIIELFIANDFLSIKTQQRSGVPDEARPEIILTNAKGKSFAVAKWANDRHEKFDKIYAELLRIESLAKNKP